MARTVPPQPAVSEPAAIKVNFGELTFADLLVFQNMEGQNVQITPEIVDLLDRVVEGGIRHRKLSEMTAIMEAINDASQEMANPGN